MKTRNENIMIKSFLEMKFLFGKIYNFKTKTNQLLDSKSTLNKKRLLIRSYDFSIFQEFNFKCHNLLYYFI